MNDKSAVDLDRLDMAIRRLEPPILSLAYLSRMDWENDAILSNVVESLANELRHHLDFVQRLLGTARMGSPYSEAEMHKWLEERCGDRS